MKISVLQWNVWYREKAERILRQIRDFEADLVCLQELTADSYLNPGRNLPEEIERLGYHSYYVMTLDRDGPEYTRMGNGIFSKFPINGMRNVYVRHEVAGQAGPSNESRAYIEIKLSIGPKQLTVGTTHLSFTHGFTYSPAKEAESKRFIEAIEHNGSNFVFTGDLNALPGSQFINELDKKFKPVGPDYTNPTWTTKPFDYQGFKADKLNWRLDYVYASSDVQVIESKILPTDVSDHLPILASFEF